MSPMARKLRLVAGQEVAVLNGVIDSILKR
jgi:hypothetical protein